MISYVRYDLKCKLNPEGNRITEDMKPATLARAILWFYQKCKAAWKASGE
jgi:hypothetical protein